MKIQDSKKKVITWNSKKFGLCEATIWDGELTDFRFCMSGSSLTAGVCTSNYEYLKELYNVLHQLFEVVDK